jgi:ribonuclease P protein component
MLHPLNKPKVYRLKGKTNVDLLFETGLVIHTKTLLLKTIKDEKKQALFKKAVDRNKIKRQLRESIRLLPKELLFSGSAMLIYKGKTKPLSTELNTGCLEIFQLFHSKSDESFS